MLCCGQLNVTPWSGFHISQSNCQTDQRVTLQRPVAFDGREAIAKLAVEEAMDVGVDFLRLRACERLHDALLAERGQWNGR